MWIKKLYATFGSLEGKSLGFENGLNIVYGRNESGKTTWCAFIRSMLFGIATREKEKAGFLPDKVKYRPKSGAMYGRAVIESDGIEYTLERTASPRTGVFSAESVTGPMGKADIPISELIGISREVFERSFFISGASLAVTESGELEKKIIALCSGGDEKTSAAEAIARLEKKRRSLRSPRGMGRLPELEEELRKIRSGEIPGGLRDIYDEVARLEAAVAKRENEEMSARLEQISAEKSIIRLSAFEGMSDSLARVTAKRDAERLAASRKRKFPLLFVLALSVSAILGGLGYFLKPMLYFGAAASLAFAIITISVSELCRAARIRKLSREMTDKYGVATEEGILSACREYCDIFSRIEVAEKKAEELSAGAGEMKEKLREKSEMLTSRLQSAKTEEKKREEKLSEEYDSLMLEYESLSLAADLLGKAAEEFSSRFSPELSRRASEIFKRLTGGSFGIIRIKNAEFDVDVSRGEASPPQGELTLSSGTRDELWLSLRLALCEILSESEGNLPIILDDVFINFDDERLSRALGYLSEIAEKRQIILFSCHRREAEYMKEKATIIEL